MNCRKRNVDLRTLADRQNGDRFAYFGYYRTAVSLKWLVLPRLAQKCQIANESGSRFCVQCFSVSSDDNF